MFRDIQGIKIALTAPSTVPSSTAAFSLTLLLCLLFSSLVAAVSSMMGSSHFLLMCLSSRLTCLVCFLFCGGLIPPQDNSQEEECSSQTGFPPAWGVSSEITSVSSALCSGWIPFAWGPRSHPQWHSIEFSCFLHSCSLGVFSQRNSVNMELSQSSLPFPLTRSSPPHWVRGPLGHGNSPGGERRAVWSCCLHLQGK